MKAIKELVRPLVQKLGLLHRRRDRFRERSFRKESKAALIKWESFGRPFPPPSSMKYELIARHQVECGAKVFVETGTWRGDSLFYLRRIFVELHSIELSPELYVSNCRRMRHIPNIFLYHGDSGLLLKQILMELPAPRIFWLDGHYSGPGTALGLRSTPIEEELNIIFSQQPGSDVVLIDDARLFDGIDYPTLETVRGLVVKHRPEASFAIESDVIQITGV